MNPRLIVMLICALAFAQPTSAAEFHVSTSGQDSLSRNGSAAEPWLTIGFAINQTQPGDTVWVRAGIYPSRVVVSGKAGTINQPIVVRSYPQELAVIDGAALTPTTGDNGLIHLSDCSYLTFSDLEIRNYATTSATRVPAGIYISGVGSGITIQNCLIHHIQQNNTTGGDAYGIAIKGTSPAPVDGLVLRNNEVHSLRTGSSESVVVNGNVTNFTIVANKVHDCNNIGIDMIGYEGTNPNAALDRARNGVVADNVVWNIDSRFNPAYGGNLSTGGGDAAAAGIYVDGATNVIIERNHVFGCNFGVELASESALGAAEYITFRSNLLHHNHVAGLIMGGYDRLRGATRYCTITNNTLYENDTLHTYTGQIALQFYVSECVFKNNLIQADTTSRQMVLHDPFDRKAVATQKEIGTGVIFDYNRYYCRTGSVNDLEFALFKNGVQHSYTTLNQWQTDANGLMADSHSTYGPLGFITAAPPVPPATPTLADVATLRKHFTLLATSAAINTGDPSFVAGPGVPQTERDFYGQSRVVGGIIDIGADEYLAPRMAWLERNFQTHTEVPEAADTLDADDDGWNNLLEYSQDSDPHCGTRPPMPTPAINGASLRYYYMKNAPELSYQVQATTALGSIPLSATAAPEQTDGLGLYWRDIQVGPSGSVFARLQVARP